ncbi:MAG: DNA-binding response regulator [Chloroflexi bacterium]|nr:DNA-binding response regulator [Chloroflexota bacterium]MDL1941882.1 response regulator [Chloroflexi bacterium CFX2]
MRPAEPSRDPYRILIVDDAPAVRESLGWLIENEPDLTVAGSASSGSDALQQMVRLKPELVILDIELPDMDGFSVTRRLKAMPNPPLVVLLSVHGDPVSKQRGSEAGCNAFVEKGQGWQSLLAVLREVLAGS